MQAKCPDWYKHGWSLDIKNQSWVEDTENQVDFITKTLELTGEERILDLACGYGRHALSFARKDFSVVGIDLTKDYIDDAIKTAKENSLTAEFILSDIGDVDFQNEFDVVLNLAVGLFTTVPVELYKLSVSLQGSFTAGITGLGTDFGTAAQGIIASLQDAGNLEQAMTSSVFGGLKAIISPYDDLYIDPHGLCGH